MLALLLLCAFASRVHSARILGVFTTASHSHQIMFQPIWKELSLRGHQVTVLTPSPLNDPSLTNLTEIDLSFSYDVWNSFNITTLAFGSEEITKLTDATFAVFEAQLGHPEVQQLLGNKSSYQFDLFLVEFFWPIMYGFKDIFNCPMVGISSLPLTAGSNDAIGNPSNPALDPEYMLRFSMNLSFLERVLSCVYRLLGKLGVRILITPRMEDLSRKYFGDIRELEVIAQEVSLVLVNSNLALQNVKPLVPAYVEISGIHIQKRKPLPEDLKSFLDNASEGVIYFSLGTNVKSHLLPVEVFNKLMNVFAQLPYKILWKFENENMPNKAKNVEIRKWLPQQDVLHHPNIKLFITQGGLQSLDEALHAEVPILTIPFIGDQKFNSHRLATLGASLSIDFFSFTEEELRDKIVELITNPKYKETVTRLSKIASDQPMPALEKAIWWIEYVISHDGAEHLKYGGVNMPFYEYFLLDVIGFLVGILVLVVYILRKLFKTVVLTIRKSIFANRNVREKVHKE